MGILDRISEMEDVGFAKLEDGEYNAIINNIEIKEDVFETELKIEYMIVDDGNKGSKISQWLKIKEDDHNNDKKMRFMQWQFKAISGAETLKGINVLEAVGAAKGNTVIIEVSSREYNGKTYQSATCKTFVSKF